MGAQGRKMGALSEDRWLTPIIPRTAYGLPIMARIVYRIDSCDATASLP